jgi:hypothetical protein
MLDLLRALPAAEGHSKSTASFLGRRGGDSAPYLLSGLVLGEDLAGEGLTLLVVGRGYGESTPAFDDSSCCLEDDIVLDRRGLESAFSRVRLLLEDDARSRSLYLGDDTGEGLLLEVFGLLRGEDKNNATPTFRLDLLGDGHDSSVSRTNNLVVALLLDLGEEAMVRGL